MKADPKPFCDLPQIEWVKSPGLDTGAPRADGIRAEDKIGFQIGIVPADGTKAAVGTSLFLGSSSGKSPLAHFIYVGYRDQSTMAPRKLNSSAAWANLEPCAGLTVVAMTGHVGIFNQKRESTNEYAD